MLEKAWKHRVDNGAQCSAFI